MQVRVLIACFGKVYFPVMKFDRNENVIPFRWGGGSYRWWCIPHWNKWRERINIREWTHASMCAKGKKRWKLKILHTFQKTVSLTSKTSLSANVLVLCSGIEWLWLKMCWISKVTADDKESQELKWAFSRLLIWRPVLGAAAVPISKSQGVLLIMVWRHDHICC